MGKKAFPPTILHLIWKRLENCLTKIFTYLSLLQSTCSKAMMQFQMLMEFKCGARNISLREQVCLTTTLLVMANLRYKSAELRICFSFLSLPLGEDVFFNDNLKMSHCLMLSAVFFCTSPLRCCDPVFVCCLAVTNYPWILLCSGSSSPLTGSRGSVCSTACWTLLREMF